MNEFEQSLYNILAVIPKAKLTTYGQLSKLSGYPNHARHVGKTLAKLPKDTKLPWFRVVSSQGKISLTGEAFLRQKKRLKDEGIEVNESGKILHFRSHLWQ